MMFALLCLFFFPDHGGVHEQTCILTCEVGKGTTGNQMCTVNESKMGLELGIKKVCSPSP